MSRLNVIACNCKDQVWSIDWIMNSKFWKADKNMKDRLNLKSKSVMLNVFSYKNCTKESKIGNANSLSPAWVRMKMKDVSYDTLCTNKQQHELSFFWKNAKQKKRTILKLLTTSHYTQITILTVMIPQLDLVVYVSLAKMRLTIEWWCHLSVHI